MKCYACGKPMKPEILDEEDDGVEGAIARNLPVPDKAWCSPQCYDKGVIH